MAAHLMPERADREFGKLESKALPPALRWASFPPPR